METLLLSDHCPDDIQRAGDILRQGGLVAIPTETVYGLAANALDGEAVKKIYQAKGRPSDNPLIVHISRFSQLAPLVREVPESAQKLAAAFWPGPPDHHFAQVRCHPPADQRGPGHRGGALPLPSHGPGCHRRGGGAPGGALGQFVRQAQPHHLPPRAGGPHRPGGRFAGRRRLRRGRGVHGAHFGHAGAPAAAARRRHPLPAAACAGPGGGGPGGAPPDGGRAEGRLPGDEV